MKEDEVSKSIAEVGVYLDQMKIILETIRTSKETIEKVHDDITELYYELKLKKVEKQELKRKLMENGRGAEINTDALQICPACGKKTLVLYTARGNQPSKLFCLGCGEFWVGVQNE